MYFPSTTVPQLSLTDWFQDLLQILKSIDAQVFCIKWCSIRTLQYTLNHLQTAYNTEYNGIARKEL